MSIPIDAFPEFFPQDFYQFGLTANLRSPGAVLEYKRKRVPNYGMTVSFEPGNIANTYVVSQTAMCTDAATCQTGIDKIRIFRDWLTVAHVYSLALIPVLLGLLFLHMLFFSREFSRFDLPDFLTALIASIFAILPLRIVLVPGDLPGLTRVDMVLAFGVVLLVLVATGKYAMWVGTGDGPNGEARQG